MAPLTPGGPPSLTRTPGPLFVAERVLCAAFARERDARGGGGGWLFGRLLREPDAVRAPPVAAAPFGRS